MALPSPTIVVTWFVSWTVSPVLETLPFVTFGVILNEPVAGSFKLMFPFVVVMTYEPVNDSDTRFDVMPPLVVVAVTLPQEVQVMSRLPFVSVIVRVEAVTPEAETLPFVSVRVMLDALMLET